jgi:hypothetical protein
MNRDVNGALPMSSHAPAQSSSAGAAPAADVQRDWEERELTHSMQLGIKKLTQFLNEFGAILTACLHRVHCPADRTLLGQLSIGISLPISASQSSVCADSTTRDKLASLNGKTARMDRRMTLIEATLDSVNEAPPT